MITRLRLAGLGVVILLITSMGMAQDNKKESQLRTVHGVTMDKGESPVASAVSGPGVAEINAICLPSGDHATSAPVPGNGAFVP